MEEKNECQTILRYNGDLSPVYKDKKKYKTHDLAVIACKKQNSSSSQIHKLVTYKCKVCHSYHIGRNGKPIDKKYRQKLRTELKPKKVVPKKKVGFTVVGKIDLSTLQ